MCWLLWFSSRVGAALAQVGSVAGGGELADDGVESAVLERGEVLLAVASEFVDVLAEHPLAAAAAVERRNFVVSREGDADLARAEESTAGLLVRARLCRPLLRSCVDVLVDAGVRMAGDPVAELTKRLQDTRGSLIAVDGRHGVGKTTLATELGRRLGMRCVHLDDHLDRHQNAFAESLRLPELGRALRDRPVIVDGVCMLAVLARMGIAYDTLVYVLDPSPETRAELDHGALGREVEAYHRQFKPHRVADFLYVREKPQDRIKMDSGNTQVDIAYINSRTKFAIVLAMGGMLSLIVGLAVLIYGAARPDTTTIKVLGMEISASGIGAVIMATSAVWAFFAYKARPSYAHKSHRVEQYDDKAQLLRREDRESSTQAHVEEYPRKSHRGEQQGNNAQPLRREHRKSSTQAHVEDD